MFYQIFISPQVKRCSIISYNHGIYELPHEFRMVYTAGGALPTQEKKRLRVLGNQEISGKCLNPVE